ncbi:hypothetical protein IKF76_01220 [Candidatus Saccharibacteria bacterium]|nr:hypothetical protein [Candidatus Saccharibacteria bacterium]
MNNQPSPQSPRRFMDFAPPRHRTASSGAPRPAQHAPVTRSTAPRPVSRPTPPPRPARPTPMSRPVAPRPQTHMVHEHVESTTIFYPSAKPTKPTAPQLVSEDDFLDIEASGLGIIEDFDSPSVPDAPDNNSYSLGGQSPFINTDKIDKRPLSSHLPKGKSTKKNVYEAKNSNKSTHKSTPTVVKGTASRGNSISLVIAIILTVILGAIVGAVAYLAFFQ